MHLGTSALKSVYTLFDTANRVIGVGNAKPNVTPSNIVKCNKGCFSGAQHVGLATLSACATSSVCRCCYRHRAYFDTDANANKDLGCGGVQI